MKRRGNRELGSISISALDLFASAMGSFMILAILGSTEKPTPRHSEVDIVYVMDTTSSMAAAAEQFVGNLSGTVAIVRSLTGTNPRIGVVAYKARDNAANEYVMEEAPLREMAQENLDELKKWGRRYLRPQGGGAEVMKEALVSATRMDWRPNARRAIIVVADEPDTDANREEIEQTIVRFVREREKSRVSFFLPPKDEGYLQTLRREAPESLAFIERQREIVAEWMARFAELGEGVRMLPGEGDLGATTIITVTERSEKS